jgi:hypothetical protein
MSLNLTESSTRPGSFVGGLSVDNLSWWFWIKAGIGFTLGAGILSLTAVIVWMAMILFVGFSAISHFPR